MNKEKIEQVNRLTPKTQISTLSTGRKMFLPRQSPIAPFFVHLSLSLAPTWGCCMGFMKNNLLIKKVVACLHALERI